MTSDALDLHIPLSGEHAERAFDLADNIMSCAVSAREALYRGSYPLALHHVREVRLALLGLIPLAKRLSDHSLGRNTTGDDHA